MTEQEFLTWHLKAVRPLRKLYTALPDKKYVVTAALYGYEDDGKTSIFAVMSEDYKIGTNPEWFTLKIPTEELDIHLLDFDIITTA